MPSDDIALQIKEEIKKIHSRMDEQKRVIKKSVGKAHVIQNAEAELHALRTHLSVLTANLAKLGFEAGNSSVDTSS